LIDNVEILGFADRGIAVTGADNANGAWQYSINAGHKLDRIRRIVRCERHSSE